MFNPLLYKLTSAYLICSFIEWIITVWLVQVIWIISITLLFGWDQALSYPRSYNGPVPIILADTDIEINPGLKPLMTIP